jgi:hypothetical protein
MAILPALSGREVVKIFEADGWRMLGSAEVTVVPENCDEHCPTRIVLHPPSRSL